MKIENFFKKTKNDPRLKNLRQIEISFVLTRNETSIHEEHLACGTFLYQRGFINEKHVQRSQRYKNSRCPKDGVYLCTSITLRALPSDKHVEPQPGFRRELVEQITSLQM